MNIRTATAAVVLLLLSHGEDAVAGSQFPWGRNAGGERPGHHHGVGQGAPWSAIPGGYQHQQHLQQTLNQSRTRVSVQGPSGIHGPGSSVSVGGGVVDEGWTRTHMGTALMDLSSHVKSLFQAPQDGVGTWGQAGEVVVPLENFVNTMTVLSKLSGSVVQLCEMERMQEQGGGTQLLQAAQAGSTFLRQKVDYTVPVNELIVKANEYSGHTRKHVKQLRDILTTIFAPTVNLEQVARLIQEFKESRSKFKESYSSASHMTNALTGSMRQHMNTCAFFVSGGGENSKLWARVLSRVSSTAKYVFAALDAASKSSSSLVDMLTGKIKPQTMDDFSRCTTIGKCSDYLLRAEARSVSAVNAFNELANNFDAYARTARSQVVQTTERELVNEAPFSPEKQEGDEEQPEMSLMLEEIGPGGDGDNGVDDVAALDDAEPESPDNLQTAEYEDEFEAVPEQTFDGSERDFGDGNDQTVEDDE